jgi:hypothetical protein
MHSFQTRTVALNMWAEGKHLPVWVCLLISKLVLSFRLVSKSSEQEPKLMFQLESQVQMW